VYGKEALAQEQGLDAGARDVVYAAGALCRQASRWSGLPKYRLTNVSHLVHY
jgi:hypothetical protein